MKFLTSNSYLRKCEPIFLNVKDTWFSNCLIIHQVKTTDNIAVTGVWISDLKGPLSASPIYDAIELLILHGETNLIALP